MKVLGVHWACGYAASVTEIVYSIYISWNFVMSKKTGM